MAQGASVSDSFEVADAKSGIHKLSQPSEKQIIPVKDHTQCKLFFCCSGQDEEQFKYQFFLMVSMTVREAYR